MVSNRKIAARALCVLTVYTLLFVGLILVLSSCTTVKNTYVYIDAYGSSVGVSATTKGSDAQDSLNGNTAKATAPYSIIP